MPDGGATVGEPAPTPADLAAAPGPEPADGPSGDAPVDQALADLHVHVESFVDGEAEVADAASVLASGRSLHELLQLRLDQADA